MNNPTLGGGDLVVTNISEQPSFRWWGTLTMKSKRKHRKLKQVYEELGKEEEKENCQWFDRETGLTGGLPAIPLPPTTTQPHHQNTSQGNFPMGREVKLCLKKRCCLSDILS